MLLFLDIDGVLHPVRTHPADHLTCRPRFEQWAAGHPHVRFVITSSWKQLYPLTVLRGYFSPEIGTRIIDMTPRLYGVSVQRRYHEIIAWLDKNNSTGEAWLALDDSAADFPPGCPQLVRCLPERGFDDAVAGELDRRITSLGRLA